MRVTTSTDLRSKLCRDERGSAMTEMVIGLPIFIMLFLGILNLMSLGIGSVLVKGRAHAKMWAKAIDVQTRYLPGLANSPIPAAGEAAYFHSQTGGNAFDLALDSGAGIAAATGLSGGIMAESYSRVKPVDFVENIGGADGKVTWNINEDYIIDDDASVSNSLMNDAIDFGAFSEVTGNGALGALNAVIDITGARPAIAAGVRYGISGDYQTDTVTVFGGIPVTMEARSHVANAPRPTSRYITFAIIRLAMEKDEHYGKVAAFKWVPDFELPENYQTGGESLAEFEDCQTGNANAIPGEESDCGDPPEIDVDADDAADEFWSNVPCNGSWCR